MTLALAALLPGWPPAVADDHLELLTGEERAWLEQLGRPLVVGTESHYHPYLFVNEAGELDGVAGDYVRLLEERLGLRFAVREYPTFQALLDGARNREVDVLPLLVAAPERLDVLDFTQPLFETHDHIFVREEHPGTFSLDTLDGLRVSTVEGYALQAHIERDYPGIDLVLMPDEIEGLRAVSLGHVDAFISELGTSTYYIEREAITNLRVAGQVDLPDPQTFGTRNDWPVLNVIIGKGLASITPEEHAAIQRRWINVGGVDTAELERLSIVILLIVLVLLLVLAWTFSLRRLVAVRTVELRQQLAERRTLEADRARLAVAVDQSAEFVLVIGVAGEIEYANPAFVEAIGRTTAVGIRIDALYADRETQTWGDLAAGARAAGIWRGPMLLAGAGGEPLKVMITIAPMFDDAREVNGYVVTGRDVTREELLETRVRQGERLSALGTLAGGIAHDFNNLLVPILGYVDLLRQRGNEDLAPYLDGITEAGDRARELVQRINIFGRGSSGEKVPLDVRHEIEDAVSFVKQLIPATVRFDCQLEHCGTVVGDRSELQQILLNLCSNAADAMAARGGELRVRLDAYTQPEDGDTLAAGSYARLTVADTGIGMDAATRARIFDPYYSEKEQSGGTGLGLAIVHGAVMRHDGHIEVESAPNFGTTFRVYFPVVPGDALAGHTREREARVPEGNGERLLLVDDDPLVLDTVANMARGLGYRVSAYASPEACLEAFEAQPAEFDLLLADFSMPGLTGIDLIERVKKLRPDVPAALMTGNAAALENYEGPVLAKPMHLNGLAEGLASLGRGRFEAAS